MKKTEIVVGTVYTDGDGNHRLVTGDDAPKLYEAMTTTDNVFYLAARLRPDGKVSGGRARLLSCTRASLASWARTAVARADLHPAVTRAFDAAQAAG